MILKNHLKKVLPSLSSVAFVLAWFAIASPVRAVLPAPDGGYPGFNTAAGQNALFSLTTGSAEHRSWLVFALEQCRRQLQHRYGRGVASLQHGR
jgi:hypothetical protein